MPSVIRDEGEFVPDDLVGQELARLRPVVERQAAIQAQRQKEKAEEQAQAAARQAEQEAAQRAKAEAATAEEAALLRQFAAWAQRRQFEPRYDRVFTVATGPRKIGPLKITQGGTRRVRVRGWVLEIYSPTNKYWGDGVSGEELLGGEVVLTTDGDIVSVRRTRWHSGSQGPGGSTTERFVRLQDAYFESAEEAAKVIASIVIDSGKEWP
jgi:hypothetical protein